VAATGIGGISYKPAGWLAGASYANPASPGLAFSSAAGVAYLLCWPALSCGPAGGSGSLRIRLFCWLEANEAWRWPIMTMAGYEVVLEAVYYRRLISIQCRAVTVSLWRTEVSYSIPTWSNLTTVINLKKSRPLTVLTIIWIPLCNARNDYYYVLTDDSVH